MGTIKGLLQLTGVKAPVGFSPHKAPQAVMATVGCLQRWRLSLGEGAFPDFSGSRVPGARKTPSAAACCPLLAESPTSRPLVAPNPPSPGGPPPTVLLGLSVPVPSQQLPNCYAEWRPI